MFRRHKSYAAETGISYRYFFDSQREVIRPGGLGAGTDYVFVVMAGQGAPFPVRIFVSRTATSVWHATHGRELDPSEQYATVKMRLFRAFDELPDLREQSMNLAVDGANLEELLEALDLT
jgi:hypothetical protein